MRRYAALCVLLLLFTVFTAHAHPGRTDGKGGHTDRSTGEYHYHHGYSAHQHENGECPYDFDDKTGESSGSSGSSSGRSYPSVTPRPTIKATVKPTARATAKPTPRVTPRATVRASTPAASTSKEDDPVSFNSILLCVGIGIAIGAIITVILAHRWVNNTKVNANMRIDSANNDRIREIAKIRAECEKRIEEAKSSASPPAHTSYRVSDFVPKARYLRRLADLDVRSRSATKRFMNHLSTIESHLDDCQRRLSISHQQLSEYESQLSASRCSSSEDWKDKYDNDICAILSSWHKDATRRTEDLECLKRVYAESIERRRLEQQSMLLEIRKANYSEETETALVSALENTALPDISSGVVFIKRDLSSNLYHHAGHCTHGLVLATRAFVAKANYVPCACCEHVPEPPADKTVFIASSRSKVYHLMSCRHMLSSDLYQHKKMYVRDALNAGYRPCSICKPPSEPAYKIWY